MSVGVATSRERDWDAPLLVIACVFVSTLVFNGPASVKMTTIWLPLFGELTFSAGALLYAITFPCTDIVGEIWGKKKAAFIVNLGLIFSILAALASFGFVRLPSAAPEIWDAQESYAVVFGTAPWITIGGLTAYFVSQRFDVWLFHRIKTLFPGTWSLALRNNLSTIPSQGIDSVLFVLIGLHFGVGVPLQACGGIILTTWTIKVLVALLDTPVVLLACSGLRERS